MDLLPLFLRLRDQLCLVVGGTAAAASKAELALRAGAFVTLVAQHLDAPALAMVRKHSAASPAMLRHFARDFHPTDLDGAALVFIATGDVSMNRDVSSAARARRIPVNVVDAPALCTFIMPAIVDRSPVQIAISTSGTSPALAGLLRAKIEQWVPPQYGRLAVLADGWRARVKQTIHSASQRRRFWERIFEGPVGQLVLLGEEDAAAARLEEELARVHDMATEASRVPLAGVAGTEAPAASKRALALASARGEVLWLTPIPLVPDLLTCRAARLLAGADLLVCDVGLPAAVLDVARRDAERVEVGADLEATVAIITRAVQADRLVLRLTQHLSVLPDGRVNDELAALRALGLAATVVPAGPADSK